MNTLEYSIIIAVFLLIVRVTYNWAQLRNIPGPLLAGCTNLWRAYYQYSGKLRSELLRLHDIHGPVVRYGVNMVSINDPAAIKPIYTAAKGFGIVSDVLSFMKLR